MSTTPLGFELPTPGGDTDEWGFALNRNTVKIDAQLQDKAPRSQADAAEAAIAVNANSIAVHRTLSFMGL